MKSSSDILTIEEYKTVELQSGALNESIDLPYLNKDCFKSGSTPSYEISQLRNNKVALKNTSYSGIIQLDKTRIHFSTKVKTNLFYMLMWYYSPGLYT